MAMVARVAIAAVTGLLILLYWKKIRPWRRKRKQAKEDAILAEERKKHSEKIRSFCTQQVVPCLQPENLLSIFELSKALSQTDSMGWEGPSDIDGNFLREVLDWGITPCLNIWEAKRMESTEGS